MPAWSVLSDQADRCSSLSVQQLLSEDPERQEDLSVTGAGITLNYANQLLTREALVTLLALADQSELKSAIAALFKGEHVNFTEDRPALHTALRSPYESVRASNLDAPDAIATAVQVNLNKLNAFSTHVRSGDYLGATGKTINIEPVRKGPVLKSTH